MVTLYHLRRGQSACIAHLFSLFKIHVPFGGAIYDLKDFILTNLYILVLKGHYDEVNIFEHF